jgi:hypothetical protein
MSEPDPILLGALGGASVAADTSSRLGWYIDRRLRCRPLRWLGARDQMPKALWSRQQVWTGKVGEGAPPSASEREFAGVTLLGYGRCAASGPLATRPVFLEVGASPGLAITRCSSDGPASKAPEIRTEAK